MQNSQIETEDLKERFKYLAMICTGPSLIYNKLISLNKNPDRSFFLWGPRQTGRSTLLKASYPDAKYIDLLKSEVFASYVRSPKTLRDLEVDAPLVIIDEVQKIPELLDEVHWCIENQRRIFALCGSSARKLKRSHANLLFGKAFENWVAHELRCYNHYCDRFLDISYWLSKSGEEVDFLIGDVQCAT